MVGSDGERSLPWPVLALDQSHRLFLRVLNVMFEMNGKSVITNNVSVAGSDINSVG